MDDKEALLNRVNAISLKYDLKAEYLGDVHSVGVRGDARSYLPTVVLVGPFPGWDILEKVSSEITNELEIGRVTYEFARRLENGEIGVAPDKVDHTRGLCGKPNVPENTPREEVEKTPAHCRCCGTEMIIVEPHSIGMAQLGIYHLICLGCPPSPSA